ncbi:MAG: hypothetical protein AAF253_00710 [Pseudomonadota bacterium]
MYDARPNRLFGDGNLLFGLATIVVVGGCFAGALMMPGFGGSDEPDPALVAGTHSNAMLELTNPEALNEAMAGEDEQRFLKTLLAVAPSRYVDLQRTFSADALSEKDQMAAIQDAAYQTLLENADILTYASGQSLNRLLDGLVRDLRTAQQSGTKYCEGSTYEGIAGAPQAALAGWAMNQNLSDADFYPTAVRVNADLLELVRQAQTNPARHGLFSKGDEAEIQKAMIGVMADPSVVRVVTASGNEADALKALNLCSVGAKALNAFRKLPDDTKGRAWAAMMAHPKVKQGIRTAQQQAAT